MKERLRRKGTVLRSFLWMGLILALTGTPLASAAGKKPNRPSSRPASGSGKEIVCRLSVSDPAIAKVTPRIVRLRRGEKERFKVRCTRRKEGKVTVTVKCPRTTKKFSFRCGKPEKCSDLGPGWQVKPCAKGECEEKQGLQGGGVRKLRRCYRCQQPKPEENCGGQCPNGSTFENAEIVQPSECSARCVNTKTSHSCKLLCSGGGNPKGGVRFDRRSRYCCKFAQLTSDCTPKKCSSVDETCGICEDKIDCEKGSSKKLVTYDCNSGQCPAGLL